MAIINFSGSIGDNPKPLKVPATVINKKQQDNKEEVTNNDSELKKIEYDIKEKKDELKSLEEDILDKESILKNLKQSILEKENFLTSLEEEILDHIGNLNGIKKTRNINIKLMDINEWKSRRLESIYSMVFINVVNLKLEQEDDKISKYIYSVIGIDINGKRDVLGIWVYNKKLSNNLLDIFQNIKSRGVEDILIISTPLTEEYSKKVLRVFSKSKIEISISDEMKSFSKYVYYKDLKSFNSDLKKIYLASTEDVALQEFKELDNRWGGKYPIAIKACRKKLNDLDMIFKYPIEIRNILYGNNILSVYDSKLNKIIKKDFNRSNDDEIINSIYLGIGELLNKWNQPLRGWVKVLSNLSIFFKERVNRELL